MTSLPIQKDFLILEKHPYVQKPCPQWWSKMVESTNTLATPIDTLLLYFFFVFCFFLYCFQPQLRHLIKFLSAIFNKICLQYICLVDWDCRIHRLLLCTEIRHPADEYPGYNIKQSDGEVPVKLEFGGMRSTLSLPSLPGPLLPGMVAPDRALFMG